MTEENTGVKDTEAAVQDTGVEETDAADQNAVEEAEKAERTVPLAALDDERKKRQEYAARLGQIEKENEQYRQFFLEQQKQNQKKEYDDGDVIPTMSDVKKVLDEAFQKWSEKNQVSNIQTQYDDFKNRHEDFEDVWSTAINLVAKQPYLEKIFAAERNPVQAAYDYAKGHPDYSSKRETQKTKEVLKKVNNNLSRPGTLTEAGGMKTSALNEEQKVWNMKQDDFNKFFDDLKKGKIKA